MVFLSNVRAYCCYIVAVVLPLYIFSKHYLKTLLMNVYK